MLCYSPAVRTRLAFALLALASLTMVSCAEDTAIMIIVRSPNLTIPEDLDGLRFEVGQAGGKMVNETLPITGGWPQSLAVLPNGTRGEVTVTVTGLKGGGSRIRRSAVATFVNGRTVDLELVFTRACYNVVCPDGDCVSGVCGGDVPDAGTDTGMPDGGVDTGTPDTSMPDTAMDTSMPDTSMPDTSMPDTSMPDTSMPDTSMPDTSMPDTGTVVGDLIISEYVEGSSNNKALEFTNRGASAFDLATCTLSLFPNGAATPSRELTLSGSLAPGDSIVICNGRFATPALCDTIDMGSVLNHNGDDAYELRCGGSLLDSFGQVGFDPGSEWESADETVSTLNSLLRRKCSIGTGDDNSADAFDPGVEWDAFGEDDFSGLGAHCP